MTTIRKKVWVLMNNDNKDCLGGAFSQIFMAEQCAIASGCSPDLWSILPAILVVEIPPKKVKP